VAIYCARRIDVEAEQYQPGRPCGGVVLRQPEAAKAEDRFGWVHHGPLPAPQPALKTPGGFAAVNPGDWIVTDPDGRQRVMADGDFRAVYELRPVAAAPAPDDPARDDPTCHRKRSPRSTPTPTR
jgi:hypothetical protein